jgi:WD40 repeat protein
LDAGRTIWSAPVASLRNTTLANDNKRVIATATTAVYVVDVGDGRIISSFPIAAAADGPIAVDQRGQTVAYLDASKGVNVLDLASGATRKVPEAISAATHLAWSNDSGLLLIGGSDGSVLAWDAVKGRQWLVPSPFGTSFRAMTWPGQPPQGVVLQMALSHDGRRFAVFRQDMPTIDIHDFADGRLLTQLTPPWGTLQTPAQVSFGPDDEIVSVWALHPMARDKPRFVAVHRLPRNFDEALTAATARLATLNDIWTPEGSRAGQSGR